MGATRAAVLVGLLFSGQAFGYDTISAGQTLNGSTAGQPAQLTACCDTPAYNHPEKIYEFTTPDVSGYNGGVATIRVTGLETTNTSPPMTYYPSVYIATTPTGFGNYGCETTTTASSSVELREQLVKNTTYYIVVDGSAAMDSYGQAVEGNFTIQLLYGETYGSARVSPYQTSIANVVKLRYHFAIADNDTLANYCQGQTWKIAFGPQRYMGSGGYLTEYQGGAPQANIYNGRRIYQNGTKTNVYYPPKTPNWTENDGEASLWFSAEDYNPSGRIGTRTQDFVYFPNLTQLVDNITGEWKSEHVSQQNLDSLGGLVTVSRIGTTSQTNGWSCDVAQLSADTRWVWRQTFDLQDGTAAHSVDFALPSTTAQYMDPAQMTMVFSEAFYVHRGFMRLYYYGFEVQQEGSSTWTPLTQWVLDITDAENSSPALYGWGYRAASYAGYNAIELSNDATQTYVHLNDTISIPDTGSCSTSICASTGPSSCTISTSTILTTGCTLDLSSQDVTVASGVQLSSLGSITLKTHSLTMNGTISSIGGPDSTIDLVTTSGLLSTAAGSTITNYSGQVIVDSAGAVSLSGPINVGTGGLTVLPGAGTNASVGSVLAAGGTFTIGSTQRPACTVYHPNPITTGSVSVTFENAIGSSSNPFTTTTASVTCSCAAHSHQCATPPPAGTFSVTPTYICMALPTCSG